MCEKFRFTPNQLVGHNFDEFSNCVDHGSGYLDRPKNEGGFKEGNSSFAFKLKGGDKSKYPQKLIQIRGHDL